MSHMATTVSDAGAMSDAAPLASTAGHARSAVKLPWRPAFQPIG